MTERLGIVYTPVEVVDFILHSVNDLLQSEFDQTLGSEGVHILDPFTGTGTFITRLLQSGLIKPDELERKFTKEIHANEIVLLAYYIAAINIEAAYHSVSGGDYQPFEGICLTDTFQLYEQDKDLLATLMPDNSNRRTRQKALPRARHRWQSALFGRSGRCECQCCQPCLEPFKVSDDLPLVQTGEFALPKLWNEVGIDHGAHLWTACEVGELHGLIAIKRG